MGAARKEHFFYNGATWHGLPKNYEWPAALYRLVSLAEAKVR